MILINLLPHREERRKRRKAAFFLGLGLAAAGGLLVVGAWYLGVEQLKAGQQERNAFITAEIKKLELQIKDIAALKAEIEALKARQKAVEDLQTDRNVPVHLLNELVRQTPEGIFFRTVKQEGQVLTLTGVAQTNERVSELLRNTSKNSEWLFKPELIEIKAGPGVAGQAQKRVFDFSMRISVKRPQDQPGATPADAGAPATSASQPAAGAAKKA